MDMNQIEILLVEDNIDDAELTIRGLKKYKMANDLVHVKDGEEALDFIFGKSLGEDKEARVRLPQVVLLDINMPKINGIEVLKAIKSDPRTRSICVVMLTSSKEDPDMRRCYELGANSYIVKPVDFDNFTEAIRNLGFYWLLVNQPPVLNSIQKKGH
jgi:two-component system, response regulator